MVHLIERQLVPGALQCRVRERQTHERVVQLRGDSHRNVAWIDQGRDRHVDCSEVATAYIVAVRTGHVVGRIYICAAERTSQ